MFYRSLPCYKPSSPRVFFTASLLYYESSSLRVSFTTSLHYCESSLLRVFTTASLVSSRSRITRFLDYDEFATSEARGGWEFDFRSRKLTPARKHSGRALLLTDTLTHSLFVACCFQCFANQSSPRGRRPCSRKITKPSCIAAAAQNSSMVPGLSIHQQCLQSLPPKSLKCYQARRCTRKERLGLLGYMWVVLQHA